MSDEKRGAEDENPEESSGSPGDDQQSSDHAASGGNMGAGRSGKEGMGSEKPTDDERLGSQKPGGSGSQQ